MVFSFSFLLIVFILGLSRDPNEYRPADILAAPSPTPSALKAPPRLIDFHVKGIRLNDSEKKVIKLFGKPKKQKIEKEDYCGIPELKKLDYEGVEIWLDQIGAGKTSSWAVLEIWVTSPNIRVEPGVSIGDGVSDVKLRFGLPYTDLTDELPHAMLYLTRDNDNAELDIEDDKVSKIRLYINPC
jgi:hypothetical protein